ncbi:MAG TPA: DUF4178 domain-containing protein [Thermoanaerobaculia bacterium]|nr:DUF4178 domain-containing protein [Thermoanaerobaculia bacterium]
MTTANCPSCGAQIEFAIGSSEVVVCSSCRSIVARTDRGIEDHGKVAALIDTGSPLRVGASGKYRRQSFRITGRTQLRHQAGGVWDEWYAALDDGRWAWLAEAQGRFYVTFKVAQEAPPFDALRVGDRVLDSLVVAEIGEAALISAEGELPWTPNAGARYEYADLSGAERKFATIDYSEEPAVVFKGEEVPLDALQIEGGEARREARAKLTTLNCSQCGGALELRAPDRAERIWCPYCGAGHDIADGKLQFFQKLKPSKTQPVIPLGSTGTIDGDAYVVAGFMERAVRFDRDYFWTEYLLYNREKSYRWLVHSDDHWSFVTPLRPGDVDDVSPRGAAKTVKYDGRTYKVFQTALARVTHVLGEFYWKVAVGEQVDTVDYVAPPFGISKELTREGAQEISYSHARYMEPREVEQAFGIEKLVRPSGVGPIQPYSGARLGLAWLAMLALLFVAAVFISMTRPQRLLVDQMFDLGAVAAPDWNVEAARVFFTQPFELTGRHNVEVRASSPLQNNWLHLGVDLVDESDGRLKSFEIPLEYYSGVDGGESWSEGKHTRRMFLSAPKKGPHVLRVEAHWEGGKSPPSQVHIRVREGVFRGLHFVLALIAISIIPFFAVIRQAVFESRRWAESSFSPAGAAHSEDEDEEEE